jgi:hypothetical protein
VPLHERHVLTVTGEPAGRHFACRTGADDDDIEAGRILAGAHQPAPAVRRAVIDGAR